MKIEKYIEENFQNALEDIISVVNIRSVKAPPVDNAPYGEGIRRALEKTLEISEKLGFRTRNIDNYIGYAEYGEGEEYIAILGHLDVVPEGELERWKTPPYNASIVDGELIGRGVLDDKSPIISSLYSLKALIEAYPNFNKRVRIIFGTNEESGDEDIKYYLKKEKAPKYCFTPDGRFPVIYAEKGIYTFRYEESVDFKKTEILSLVAGEKSNIVPEKCELYLKSSAKDRVLFYLKSIDTKDNFKYEVDNEKIKIVALGKSAHASSPHKGENALLKMYRLLNNVLLLEDSCKKYVNFIDKYIFDDLYGEKLNIAYEVEELGKLTLNAAITRFEENKIFVKFNVRYPASPEYENFEIKLKEISQKEKIKFIRDNKNEPLYFPKDSILVNTLQKVYKKVTGRNEEPASLGGGTYAKLMPNTVAFGPNYKEYNGKPHSPNESININMLKEGIIIYSYALKELGTYI